jgi:Cu+-exporting ATPase
MQSTNVDHILVCFHCGEDCIEDLVEYNEKNFCCPGCKLVYEILNENNLCNYYDLSDSPGVKQSQKVFGNRFAYLDNQSISDKLIKFKDQENTHLVMHIPNMHCSSCIWLLEHLQKLEAGIVNSKVEFIQKEIWINYNHHQTSLRKIVEKLTLIGYEPELNLEQINKSKKVKKSKSRIYKIGVAGFAFGNIMLLSFPEYFANGIYPGDDFRKFFGYLNLVLAIPVFFYSANEFLFNSIKSFRQRAINIDVPIAIGIVAMFVRSTYEVLSSSGAGYFDSMTGLVFFMLIGRNFQEKTFDWLSFERDYKSYFPIAVTRLLGSKEETVAVHEVQVNDQLLIRCNEIVPADVILLSERAEVDYSFVSGESKPVSVFKSDRIFAGGKLVNGTANVLVLQPISQSYLTQLWNQLPDKSSASSGFQKMVGVISKWFVIATLAIATTVFLYWYTIDLARSINGFTAVLVIACACALALSAPFTFGNMLRILGKKGIYLRNANVIERIADINKVVFDKTGTLTISDQHDIRFVGNDLTSKELELIYAVSAASSHPLSRQLAAHLKLYKNKISFDSIEEIAGYGICGQGNGNSIRIGNLIFVNGELLPNDEFNETVVFVAINDEVKGKYIFNNSYRANVGVVFNELKRDKISLSIISGDHEGERKHLEQLTHQKNDLLFSMHPKDKMNYIKRQQDAGSKILMVGDGLNDAGALLQSNVGIAVSGDINNFTPACDGIILGKNFDRIPALIEYCKSGQRIILISFIISLAYNTVGLFFAVQGTLSPVIAAILMPISTSSLVLYTVIASSIRAHQLKLK